MQVENTEPPQETTSQPTTETPEQSQAAIDAIVKDDFDNENETAELENEAFALFSTQQLASTYGNDEPDYSKTVETPVLQVENPKKSTNTKKSTVEKPATTKKASLKVVEKKKVPTENPNRLTITLNFKGEISENLKKRIAESGFATIQEFFNELLENPLQLSAEKLKIVNEVIEVGIQTDYFKSRKHFYNKALDFVINSQLANKAEKITQGFTFGIPDTIETTLFDEGYYQQFLKDFEVCK